MAKLPKNPENIERDELLDAVGHRIKLARQNAKLTQKELGEILGAPQSWIHLMEDGQQNLQLKSLRKIAQALGVSIRDLLPESLEAGPEFEASLETNEMFQKLLAQLTEFTAMVHRLYALTDKRKGSERPAKPVIRSGKNAP